MGKRRAERIRRRVTCELMLGGRSYRGIVLDLSETGVFVQTEATPPPGARLRVKFHAAGGIEIEVDACVARRQVAPRELASVVRGGLGLRVEQPPEAYFKLIGMEGAQAGSGSGPRGGGAPRGAPSPQAPAPAPEPAPAPKVDERPEFRVRVKQSDGPRSRVLKLRASSPEEARKSALKELGGGWEILSVDAA